MFTSRTKFVVSALLTLTACANWGGCPAQVETDPFDFLPLDGGDQALELDPAFIDAQAKIDRPGGADALWQAGGGLIGRRMEMFELLPDAAGLFPTNDAEKSALVERFRGTAANTDDLLLCIYAELLELYGDPSVIPALVDFRSQTSPASRPMQLTSSRTRFDAQCVERGRSAGAHLHRYHYAAG